MKNVPKHEFIKLAKFSPRKNFPRLKSGKKGEELFVLSFARALRARQQNKEDFLVREFALNGYGIADLLCLTSEPIKGTQEQKMSILAFEMKMRDWRKALSQAFRYRYFADKSIVVLPPEQAALAAEYLTTFKRLRVGLWSFERAESTLVEFYTPPLLNAISLSAKKKALGAIPIPSYFSKSPKRSYSLK